MLTANAVAETFMQIAFGLTSGEAIKHLEVNQLNLLHLKSLIIRKPIH